MDIVNNDLCDILYKIRDLINQGDYENAIELSNKLKTYLVYAHINSDGFKCETTCANCKDGCK